MPNLCEQACMCIYTHAEREEKERKGEEEEEGERQEQVETDRQTKTQREEDLIWQNKTPSSLFA